MSVDASKIATVIQSLTKVPEGYVGRAKVLDTNSGRDLAAIIKGGGRVGQSSKGVGKLRKDKQSGLDIVESYNLIGIDSVVEPSHNHFVSPIYESFDPRAAARGTARTNNLLDAIFESISSQASLTSQTLDADKLAGKVLQFLNGLGNTDLLVDFDRTYGMFQQDPSRSSATFTQNLETLRKDTINKLQALIIASQDDGEYTNTKTVYNQYIKAIDKESSAITKAAMRREARDHFYSKKLMEATVQVLKRQGKASTTRQPLTVNDQIQSIRKNAGKRPPNLQREYEGISRHYDSLEKKAREHYERTRDSNLIRNRTK